MYPEPMIAPFREELTSAGVQETRTAQDVEKAVTGTEGTVMVVVNSVCGCAAGRMRPGVKMAMKHAAKPDRVITVFAGQDREATDKARSYFTGYMPSSPSIGILQQGKLVFMMERSQIERSTPELIANELTSAFEKLSVKANA